MKEGDSMASKRSRERLAAKLQAEKEDLNGWEVESSTQTKEPSMSLSVRLKPDEIDMLQIRSTQTGTTVSAIIRDAIHEYFQGTPKYTAYFAFSGQSFFATEPTGPFTEARKPDVHVSDPQVIEYKIA